MAAIPFPGYAGSRAPLPAMSIGPYAGTLGLLVGPEDPALQALMHRRAAERAYERRRFLRTLSIVLPIVLFGPGIVKRLLRRPTRGPILWTPYYTPRPAYPLGVPMEIFDLGIPRGIPGL